MIIKYVALNGPQKWTQNAQQLKGRMGKQVRERWHNHINPLIKKIPWSYEEEMILFICHKCRGSKWTQISLEIPGRTDNSIKNHWNSTMQKKLATFIKNFDDYIAKRLAEKSISGKEADTIS